MIYETTSMVTTTSNCTNLLIICRVTFVCYHKNTVTCEVINIYWLILFLDKFYIDEKSLKSPPPNLVVTISNKMKRALSGNLSQIC